MLARGLATLGLGISALPPVTGPLACEATEFAVI
jgi:hypothetical protein